MKSDLTVLMSVYYNTRPHEFSEAMESMINQTLKPDFIYVGVDGSICQDLESLLSYYSKKYNYVKLFYFEINIGLGKVLSNLSQEVSTTFVARMDSDDISMSNRFEIMLEYLRERNLDLLGSYIVEYSLGLSTKYLKKVPLSSDEIKRYSKFRNPFNHVTIIIRKTLLEKINYEDCKLAEDWYLWLRIIKANRYRYENIPIPTVTVNVGNYSRLGGFKRFMIEKDFYIKFFKENYISFHVLVINLLISFFAKYLLSSLNKYLYKFFLREPYV